MCPERRVDPLLRSLRQLATAILIVAALIAMPWSFRLAAAHPGDKGFATITLGERAVRYTYWLPQASFHRAGESDAVDQPSLDTDYARVLEAVRTRVLISADDKPCAPEGGVLRSPVSASDSIGVQMSFACGVAPRRTLRIRDDLVDALGTGYVTIANIQWLGGSQQFVFRAEARETQVELTHDGSQRGVGSFFMLGIEHILAGWDHLLFLLGLLLLGGTALTLIKIVTAFTVAHSLTLAAAALDVIALPSALVEALIALSIAYVAAENLLLRDRARSKRWLVAFGFGLVHGFGFSGVLRELGLPRDGLLWSLLGFNLGVEAGQLIVLAIALPLLWIVRTAPWLPRASTIVSGGLVVVGLAVFVQRAVL